MLFRWQYQSMISIVHHWSSECNFEYGYIYVNESSHHMCQQVCKLQLFGSLVKTVDLIGYNFLKSSHIDDQNIPDGILHVLCDIVWCVVLWSVRGCILQVHGYKSVQRKRSTPACKMCKCRGITLSESYKQLTKIWYCCNSFAVWFYL